MMLILKQKNIHQPGFTIVELLIVIVVIAILATITVISYNNIQAKARDSERASDMNAVQKVLEMYFTEKGSYPTTAEMQDQNWRKTNLATTNQDIFINPQDNSGSGSSVNGAGSTVATNRYSYYALPSKDNKEYVLNWRLEEGNRLMTVRVSQ